MNEDRLKVVLLVNWGIGRELLGFLHSDDRVQIKCVVTGFDESGRDKWANCVYHRALEYGYNIVRICDVDFEGLRKLILDEAADLLVVHAYSRILPELVFQAPVLGSINIHPSLLPSYKGRRPSLEVLKNKETETGLTCHYIDAGIDTGDIINQVKVKVVEGDTMESLIEKMKTKVHVLMDDVITRIVQNAETTFQNEWSVV